MCGRYASSADVDLLVEEFEIDEVDDDLPPASWNIAPTDPVPAVLERAGEEGPIRRLRPLRWGLVPSWAKDTRIGARMINARVETVADKPAFRRALRSRRCLLPADGYYEWYATERTDARGRPIKQPFFLHRADGAPLVMAGLYEYWRDPTKEGDQAWWLSCAVITTSATDALGQIHDRMPMIIRASARDRWLDPTLTQADAVLDLLAVTEADQVQAYAVSTRVNSVRNNGADLIDPLAGAAGDGAVGA